MNTILYLPSKDEVIVRFRSVKGKPRKELGRFKLWRDDEGNICALDGEPFTEELEEFRKNLNTIHLGGIWKGVEITEEDIESVRKEMWKDFGK